MIRLLLALLLVPILIFGQGSDSLQAFARQSNAINKKGMTVLAGWSILSVAAGGIGSYTSHDDLKYFHQMNAVWGGTNFLIAVVALRGLVKKENSKFTLAETVKNQNSKEKVFLFNAGLDIAYIFGGLYLKERGESSTRQGDRLKGYGKSFMLQGAGLLVFDGVMYLLQKNHTRKRLFPILESLSLTGNEIKFSYSL